MEFQRRVGHGRLSEIFGAATLPQDRFLRTVGFGRAARSAWEHLPAEARQQVDAYVAGVNAFIGTHHGARLPPEFTLLRFEPEPFTGPDVLVWVKMMAWDLSVNYSSELMRARSVAKVGRGANGTAAAAVSAGRPEHPERSSTWRPGSHDAPGIRRSRRHFVSSAWPAFERAARSAIRTSRALLLRGPGTKRSARITGSWTGR